MTKRLSSQTTLGNLKKEAKRWLKAIRSNDSAARARLDRTDPKAPAMPSLRDVQYALATEYGFAGWTELKTALASRSAGVSIQQANVEGDSTKAQEYESLANDLIAAYDSGEPGAMERLNRHYGQSLTCDDLRAQVWKRVYAARHAGGGKGSLDIGEARLLMARTAGFPNWAAFLDSAAKGTPPPGAPYAIKSKENRISPRRMLTASEWDVLIGAIKERRITHLDANGFMTDEVLGRVARIDHVTRLDLGGSRELSDDGLKHLARMPQLERLSLSEYPGGKLTDRGLEVLRLLPGLREFEMTWQRGITDAGVANLKFCEKLETVNLMGSPTGDGAIDALRGKPRLRHFNTGRLVTDAGLAGLHDFPIFRSWQGDGRSSEANRDDGYEPTHLLIDGPFTNEGLASLVGLEGVYALDLFWHVTGITTDGFEMLTRLPNLGSLGCDGELSDDRAMRHIAKIPSLRKLRAQGSAATDDGFVALSGSSSLAIFWVKTYLTQYKSTLYYKA